jgi:Protein of unknown function (DUF3037)
MTRMRAKYVVVRYMPSTLRAEFANVGVILLCEQADFQDAKVLNSFSSIARIKDMPGFDGHFVRHAVTKLRDAVSQKRMDLYLGNSAPEGRLTPENISLLPSVYGNNIRLSEIFTCITENPALTLETLFSELVGLEQPVPVSNRMDRARILRDVSQKFRQLGLFDVGLQEEWVLPVRTQPRVDLAYKNHVWHCYQAMSFELSETRLLQTVNAYRQVKRDAQESPIAPPEIQNAKFACLTKPIRTSSPRVADLMDLLKDEGFELLDYRDANQIAQDIARDLQAHQSLTVN